MIDRDPRRSRGLSGSPDSESKQGRRNHAASVPQSLIFGPRLFAPYTAAGDWFRAEKPQIWSPTGYRDLGSAFPYDIHPDGKRLAIIAAADGNDGVAQGRVVFFVGFGDYLKKIARGKP